MKHLVYGRKSLFIDDEAADVLMEYAAHVAQLRTGGRVDLRGFSSEGNAVVATVLLNSGSDLTVETTDLQVAALDNGDAVDHMHRQIERFAVSPDFFAGFSLPDDDPAASDDRVG